MIKMKYMQNTNQWKNTSGVKREAYLYNTSVG